MAVSLDTVPGSRGSGVLQRRARNATGETFEAARFSDVVGRLGRECRSCRFRWSAEPPADTLTPVLPLGTMSVSVFLQRCGASGSSRDPDEASLLFLSHGFQRSLITIQQQTAFQR